MVAFLLCAGVIVSPALLKAAGSLSFTRPVNDRITDHFKMREEHPETGQRNRPHRGTDYGTACGTRLSPPAGGQLECTTMGGYGGTANVYHECGVMERYAHLQNCDTSSGTMVTGGGRGMAGAGTSTGCHLHYEIWLDGISVDPEYAYGKNMCDPAVREDLIRDAQDKLNGLAGGGGGGHGPPAQEPGNGATSVTYV